MTILWLNCTSGKVQCKHTPLTYALHGQYQQQRKLLHKSMLGNFLHDLQGQLGQLVDSSDVKERLKLNSYSEFHKHHEKLKDSILEEVCTFLCDFDKCNGCQEKLLPSFMACQYSNFQSFVHNCSLEKSSRSSQVYPPKNTMMTRSTVAP